ncbi:MAG: hypothetical protein M1817_002928 [Caeruleum heppii]|nr:MAG: hypothetical protein M1817_002928 [Caeruleum heppii]
MAATTKTDKLALDLTLKSTLSLFVQFETTLSAPPSTPPPASSIVDTAPPEPLDLFQDAATLTRAHTTKLSLLILNKPFTPSAICTILRELSTNTIPAMLSGVELTHPTIWGNTFHTEVKARVTRLLRELRNMLGEVSAAAAQSTGTTIGQADKQRDSLSSTGVVWEACDALIQLKKIGLAGVVVQKVRQYHELLEDAIAELREWSEETSDDEDDEDADDVDTTSLTGPKAKKDRTQEDAVAIDDLFTATPHLPRSNTSLRSLLSNALKRLSLYALLYKALIKRRLETIPTPTKKDMTVEFDISTLNRLLEALASLPEEVDELASFFYDMDEQGVQEQLTKCSELATDAGTLVEMSWEGTEDAYTNWVRKWVDLLGRAEEQDGMKKAGDPQ